MPQDPDLSVALAAAAEPPWTSATAEPAGHSSAFTIRCERPKVDIPAAHDAGDVAP